MSKQYAFYFEADRCIKCWSCEVACKHWHGIKAGTVKLRRVTEITQGTFPEVTRTFLSVTCRHCAKAPCASVCPVEAITKHANEGIVLVNAEKCIGCGACLDACPFGIPQFNNDGIMQKCDMCLDRIENGQQPICTATCPVQALHWGTVENMTNLASQKAANKLVRGL